MLPVIQLGTWQVSTYSLMLSLALVIAGMYSIHRMFQYLDAPPLLILRGTVITILAGLLSTLLMQWFSNLYLYTRYGAAATEEGMRIVWTLLGGGIAAALHNRLIHQSSGRIFDLSVALPVPLGLTILRLGCIAAGCCYGKLTGSWLGIYLPDHDGYWAMRYPTQLMSFVANFLIFITLWLLERYLLRRANHPPNWYFDGFLSLLFVVLYSVKRIVIGVLRENGAPLLGAFTWLELFAIASLVISVVLMLWNLQRQRVQPEIAGSSR